MRHVLTRRAAPLAMAIVCFFIGLLLVAQFHAQSRSIRASSATSAADQAALVASVYENNRTLRKEIDNLQAKLQEHERSLSPSDLEATVRALNQLRLVNGMSEVSGPGVVVTIHGSLRPQDVLDLVNELRNAGAEALAINDERIVARSALAGDTRQLALHGRPLRSPHVLRAIGHPETLERALLRKGGLVIYLETTYSGIRVQVTKQEKITAPVYRDGYTFRFARAEQ